MADKESLGEMLRQRRVAIPLTQMELSQKSGVSPSHLGRIESGERFPSASILQKIAAPLGFGEDELLIRAGYMSQKIVDVEVEIQPAGEIDPHVARLLSQEPIEVQGVVMGLLHILKALRGMELPELRQYMERKYPDIEDKVVSKMEDLIKKARR